MQFIKKSGLDHIFKQLFYLFVCSTFCVGCAKTSTTPAISDPNSNISPNIHLLSAIRENSFSDVQNALDNGAEVDEIANNGETALILAIREHRNRYIVELLVENGANVNAVTSAGDTALIFAINVAENERELAIAELLLENGADVNAKDVNGETALIHSLRKLRDGRINNRTKDIIKQLLENGANVNAVSSTGDAALILAINVTTESPGNAEIAELLLEKGADVNAKDANGETAAIIAESKGLSSLAFWFWAEREKGNPNADLYIAARQGSLEGVQKALNNGADVNARFTYEFLQVRAKNEYRAFWEDETALIRASDEGWLDIVKLLLKYGADPDLLDGRGFTALMHAAIGEELEIAKILIENGANVDVRSYNGDPWINKDGNTALMTLSSLTEIWNDPDSKVVEITELLLNHGADVNAINDDGETALMLASKQLRVNSVKTLLAYGADVNIKNNDGYTAISYTKESGHFDRIPQNIDKEAKIIELLQRKWDNSTPNEDLLYAVTDGDIEAARKALARGADANFRSMKGQHKAGTVLMAAAASGNPAVVELLLKHGANVNAVTEVNMEQAFRDAIRDGDLSPILGGYVMDNLSALTRAVLEKHDAVQKILIEHGAFIDVALMKIADSSMTWSQKYSNEELVKILKQHENLFRMIEQEDINAVQASLLNRVSANATMTSGTALMFAVSTGNVEMVKLLLEFGANVNFHSASELGVGERLIVAALEPGLIHDEDSYRGTILKGTSALQVGALHGYSNIVQLLLEYGANVNATTMPNELVSDNTALMLAAANGHLEVVELLLAHGSNINAHLSTGVLNNMTVVMAAVNGGHYDVATLLIERGANVFTKITGQGPYKGWTVLDFAKERAKVDMNNAFLQGVITLLTHQLTE